MGLRSDFFGGTSPDIKEPVEDHTKLLLGICGMEGVTRLNHDTKGDFDAPLPVPGMKFSPR